MSNSTVPNSEKKLRSPRYKFESSKVNKTDIKRILDEISGSIK